MSLDNCECIKLVLILVLMEDTLRGMRRIDVTGTTARVLILVLMEDTLRVSKFIVIKNYYGVLILVLMEDTLRV